MGRLPLLPERYKQPRWGGMDRAFKNTLRVSGILGGLFLVVMLIVPARAPQQKTVEEVPERLAKLILEKPKGKKLNDPSPMQRRIEEEKVAEAEPEPEPKKPEPKPQRRVTQRTEPKPTPQRGTKGREIANKQVKAQVASVTKSLDKTLSTLSESLPTSTKESDNKAPRTRRSRRVQRGRSAGDVGKVAALSSGSSADVGGALEGATVEIGSLESLTIESGGGGGGSDGGGGGSGGNGDIRSNAALLAVVRRYAAGIQYCYDEQLKSQPELRGKLVVSITVTPSGKVSETHVVQDTLGSSAVSGCVLSQIQGWNFGQVTEGEVTFRTPFVFTAGN